MLKKTSRLTSQEIAALHKVGRRASTAHLSMVYMVNTPQSGFAISLGKAAVKSAVSRNHIRRRMYTIVRERLLPRLHVTVQGLIIIRKSAVTLPLSTLREECDALFSSANLLE